MNKNGQIQWETIGKNAIFFMTEMQVNVQISLGNCGKKMCKYASGRRHVTEGLDQNHTGGRVSLQHYTF
jgi:hypothetical protein